MENKTKEMKKKNDELIDYTWNLEFSWEEWQELFERDLEEILKTLGIEKSKESRRSTPALSSKKHH